MTLDGKVAVVTGAAGGLGAAILRELIDQGAVPVLLDLEGEALERAAREVERTIGTRPLAIPVDVTAAKSVSDAAARVEAELGRCDVLVNNAAILVRAPLAEHPIDLWDRIIAVNLRGYFVCAKAFGRLMIQAGGGTIVNVASLAAEAPSYSNGAYCASKAGVLALTRQLAVEWGPKGVRANAVSPAYMATPMTADMAGDEATSRTKNAPLGRVAETRDIARVIAFLAGPHSSYLNGVDVPVDGALSSARSGGWAGPAR